MENELQHISATPRDLTFHLLERITNKFSKDHIIGYGGYGVVYKGVLDNGEVIAVKKLYNKHPGLDDDEQFKNECTNLMRVQHQNIVSLVGYCHEIAHKVVEYNGKYVVASVEEKALCFEYLEGGSLDKLLSGREGYSKCGDMHSQDFIYLVCENWGKTLQATMSSHTSHEVKACIEIALRCVEADRAKRPTISEIVDELNKIDTAKRSLIDQVTNLHSKQAFNQYASSGAANAESDLTAGSSPPSNPRIKYGDEGTSIGMKEKEHRTLEHKVLEEDPAECFKTQDPDRRSGGRPQRLLSAWARVWPTLKTASEGRDGLLWWHDLAHCQAGDLSVAAIQANNMIEDQCCVESALPLGTFVSVFDGHGGPEAARFACDHLLPNLREAASGPQGMTSDAIRKAFLATEEGFIALVSRLWETKPRLATVGSCCLVGVVHHRTLFVANLGDSRAVLGKVGGDGKIAAEQLSMVHNASEESVRQELIAQHPDDPHIVLLKNGIWRVKGIIQLSRSIGDAYLKDPQYNREPILTKFRVPGTFSRPILSANPSIVSHSLQPSDRFIIFASDGLWEFLSNQEAVEIVEKHQHAGSARRLIKSALTEAARKRDLRYSDLRGISKGVRRHFHDDITVIVLFIDHEQGQPLYIRCGLDDRS